MLPAPSPSLSEATQAYLRVAAQSFGGPAGQVAVMHRILVDEKGWISEERFLHALGFCMVLPGPEAQQLATYVGWSLHGVRGGLIAGGLFVLPGFLSILALSVLYTQLPQSLWVSGALFGLRAAALALILEAGLRIGGRVLKNNVMRVVCGLAFLLMLSDAAPFPLIVLGAGMVGLLGARLRPAAFLVVGSATPAGDDPARTRPPFSAALITALTWLTLWLGPVLGLSFALGEAHVLTQLAQFFAGAATVTFGGAYAVLAYVAEQAVEVRGWLSAAEMLDGLSMAETTPGPLIQVVQHVGFLAAWRQPAGLPPLLAGVIGAVVTTWVTFAPSFLWIFTGAPYIEWLRGDPRLRAALSTVSAAVVGVIAHLGVWLTLHVCFTEVQTLSLGLGLGLKRPVLSSVDLPALGIASLAAVALLRFHLGAPRTLLGAVLLGLVWSLLRG
ncbi:MAG: chromate efflux transporter [Deltaproteobacteria bacterium]|nr:chromate efflux transporter [Deltaproteobacteria bacterium]